MSYLVPLLVTLPLIGAAIALIAGAASLLINIAVMAATGEWDVGSLLLDAVGLIPGLGVLAKGAKGAKASSATRATGTTTRTRRPPPPPSRGPRGGGGRGRPARAAPRPPGSRRCA